MTSFTSFEFLWFLAAFLVLYALTPYRFRVYALLLGGLVFAFWNSVLGAIILICFTVVNFLFGLLIQNGESRSRTFVVLGVLVNVIALAAFKIATQFSASAEGGTPLFNPSLLSFFTFTCIAYLVDIYRGTVAAEVEPLYFGAYTMMFPKLLQGPITRYGEVGEQLDHPRYTLRNIQSGMASFILGFAIKMLVSDQLLGVWKYDLTRPGSYEFISTPLAWYGLLCYCLYIYLDWQAYMRMAIGIGKMLGFQLPENFNYPYLARSISDYYRRWHMTLTRWFKDYLYIPLGGNRKGMGRTVLNILIVWLVTSLWHGLDWNFLLWGMSIGLLIVLEKLFLGKWLDKHPLLSHIYVLLFIPLTWCFFAIDKRYGGIGDIGLYFSRLFPFFGTSEFVNGQDVVVALEKTWYFFLIGIALCFPFLESLVQRFQKSWVMSVLLAILFWFAVYVLQKNGATPNAYAGF